jgi:protein TonB
LKFFTGIFLVGLFMLAAIRPFELLLLGDETQSAEPLTAIDEVIGDLPKEAEKLQEAPLELESVSSSDESPADMGFAASGWGEGGFSSDGSAGGKVGTSRPQVTAARALKKSEPDYPSEAKNKGITGYVTLKLGISSSGTITDSIIVASEPAGVFDQSALSAVQSWKFSPAVKEGQAVASFLIQKISFRME